MGKPNDRPLSKEKLAVPGPGNYEVKSTLDRRGYGFGQQRSKQREPDFLEKSNNPGPGNYN
jgi:hypothetical protein